MNKLQHFVHAKQTAKPSQFTGIVFEKVKRVAHLQKLSTKIVIAGIVVAIVYGLGISFVGLKPLGFRQLEATILFMIGVLAFKMVLEFRITSAFFQQYNLLAEIERTDDPKDIGYLLGVVDVAVLQPYALHLPESKVPDVIHAAVKRLLRRIEAEDISSLNCQQRKQLYKLLLPIRDVNMERRHDPQLALELLGALERMRIHEAIPYVRQLVKQPGVQIELREAAYQCLICLEESLAQHQTDQTLLRPSAASTPPDMLLRPAIDIKQSASEAAEQLLRSTASLEAAPASNRNTALLPNCELTASQEQSLVQQLQTGPRTKGDEC